MSESGLAGLPVQHPPKIESDTHLSLADIRVQHQRSLVRQMLEIQKYTDVGQKSIDFVQNLQCLTWLEGNHKRRRQAGGRWTSQPSKYLRRDWINASWPDSPFVAISYVWRAWEATQEEASTPGEYRIESEDGKGPTSSKVRDIVYERLIAYAKHHDIEHVWIDQECINQSNVPEKQTAVQSMDLVYSNSYKPVALLSVEIDTQDKLDLLNDLLRERFIDTGDYAGPTKLDRLMRPKLAMRILNLLDYITSDPWWGRAWPFQEEFCSFWKFCLLIRHRPGLNKKRAEEVCGNVHNELEIQSADLRNEATKFCRAYLRKGGTEWQDGCNICNKILAVATKYNVISRSGEIGDRKIIQAMSPEIFADIGRRNIEDPYDALAIAANCCDYSVRLHTAKLRDAQYSLSVCLLALYLLNGEIVRNDEEEDEIFASVNIFEYLSGHSLDNLDPPVDSGELTFTKRCRFRDVEFSEDGSETVGCLWILDKEIDTADIRVRKVSSNDDSSGRLRAYERCILFSFALKLKRDGFSELFREMKSYLAEDENPKIERTYLFYKYLMATELVRAIENGAKLHLGYLLDNENSGSSDDSSSAENDSDSESISTSDGRPHRAIFILKEDASGTSDLSCDDGLSGAGNTSGDDSSSRNSDYDNDNNPYHTSENSEQSSEQVVHSFVFTAWKPGGHRETRRGIRNADKYVSIEVDLDGQTEDGLPRLRTKRWINGLCFFSGCPRSNVVFPWPTWMTK